MELIVGDSGGAVFYLGWLLFSLLGFAVQKYVLFLNRKSKNAKFKLSYFWKDNKIDIVAGFVISLIAARFNYGLMGMFGYDDPTNGDKMLLALLFGFFYTSVIQIIRKTSLGDYMRADHFADGTKK